MTHSRFHIAAALIAVSLLAGPVAEAGSRHPAKSSERAGRPGTELRGGTGGVTRDLPGGVKLHLAPGARVRFERETHLKLAAGPPSTPTQSLSLIDGRIDVQVPSTRPLRMAVLVRAPHKVSVVVKGGRATLISEKSTVTVGAREGEMLVAVGNDWKPLAQGLARSIGPADPAGRPRVIPGVTHLAVSEPLLLSLNGKARSTTAVWLPVRGAARYDVSVSRADGSVVSAFHTSTHTARLDGLTPGRYEVRAKAVDRFGLEGPISTPDTVRVIGVKLSPGSFISDGAVLLGRRQRVHFTHIDGVEVSYDAATTYIPAPPSIGLARGNATRVRFRAAGADRDAATLKLAPRALSADIEIRPRMARWPGDKVTVTLRVIDWNGRPVPEWIKLEPHVQINVTPVDMHWTRHGTTWHGLVPVPSEPGPWVVRVEVKDQFGESLGRNFLEIARSPSRVAASR